MRLALIVVVSLAALGCDEKKAQTPLPAAREGLTYEGSSTIGENIMPEATEAFRKETGIAFTRVGVAGSGAGYKAVMEGKAVFGGMSRDLKAAERERKPYYQIIGYDGIAVIVNEANPVRALSREQVKGIFTGVTKNWKEVGGKDAPVVVITEIKTSDRATISEFKQAALDGADYGPGKEIDKPADCAKAVAADPNAVTHAALAFVVPGTRALTYDGFDPTPNNVTSGAYALSRPLLLLTRAPPTGDTKNFFDFLMSPAGQQIVGKRFVPAR